MKDKENKLKYVKVSKDNYEIAYNIQKQIWVDEPDYDNFKNKLDTYNFDYDYVIINHGSTILDKDDNII